MTVTRRAVKMVIGDGQTNCVSGESDCCICVVFESAPSIFLNGFRNSCNDENTRCGGYEAKRKKDPSVGTEHT
jgi:hypothetical protein